MIIVLKDGDFSTPAAKYQVTSSTETKALESWVGFLCRFETASNINECQMMRNRLPSAMELDEDTFQEVMNAQHEPLVVIAATPKDDMTTNAQKMRDIAMQWRDAKGESGIVFTWMDIDRWASWLKGMYGISSDDLPHVVVANHAVSLLYLQNICFLTF